MRYVRFLAAISMLIALAAMLGCNSEESSITSPPPGPRTISVDFANPLEICVDSDRHRALLLHGRTSSRGTALQLVDLQSHTVINTRILDFNDVFDVEFLPGDKACLVVRTQDRMEYAVQFLTLPDLALGARVMTADTAGTHGYLAVDGQAGYVYYSHAGGGDKDGLFKISLGTQALVDADSDDNTRAAFDNDLVTDLFERPGRIYFDGPSQKLMVANLDADYITQIDAGIWGTLRRADHLSLPLPGVTQMNTLTGGLNAVRAEAMAAAGEGRLVFAGTSDGRAFLSRIQVTSTVPWEPVTMPSYRRWAFRNADLLVHPREDMQWLFILQRDSTRFSIGRYNVSSLSLGDDFKYLTRAIPDTSISAVGLDTELDLLIVGDAHLPRLELIEIE